MSEIIKNNNEIIAVIIRGSFEKDGIEFFTPENFSQQLAYMKRPKDYEIEAHTHKIVQREVLNTLETIFIKSGKVKIEFFTEKGVYLESRILNPMDVILLVSGGHGFTMLETSEMIEVKQGPYAGIDDKIRFGEKMNEKSK